MSTPMDASFTLTFPSDRETVITRVFAAMTQPTHVRQWYGLRDHTIESL